jgi:hypothetical protein
MSDTRTRAAKLAAMAAATESPHEAAAAAGKLAEMQKWRKSRQARDPSALMRTCEIPDCGRQHFGNGLCSLHWEQAKRPAVDIPKGIRCGAETFDGIEARRCTRPASQVRDGLLVCRQHERLDFVSWAGRGRRLARSLPERSVPQLTARRRVPEGWHLFDHGDAAATRVQDLPVTATGGEPGAERGHPMVFDTEAVAAEIERDGVWPVVVRYGMSYQHARRIRNGWRPKNETQPFVRSRRPGDPPPSVREVFPL